MAKRKLTPKALRCEFKPATFFGPGAFVCARCGCWTSNLPLYKDDICAKKDRRSNKDARRLKGGR